MVPVDDLYDMGGVGADEGLVAIVAIFYLIYYLVTVGIGIAQYVLQSVGLYSIAKRRGIQHSWLSWLPIGSTWILGCISDQYQYVVKGKVKSKRKSLLVLSLSGVILGMVGMVSFFVTMLKLTAENGMYEPAAAEILPVILGFLGVALVVFGIFVANAVITFMALYDLYASSEPKNCVLYLVLSIFINVIMPLLVFLCRKKDLGMPPRKTEPVQPQGPATLPPV